MIDSDPLFAKAWVGSRSLEYSNVSLALVNFHLLPSDVSRRGNKFLYWDHTRRRCSETMKGVHLDRRLPLINPIYNIMFIVKASAPKKKKKKDGVEGHGIEENPKWNIISEILVEIRYGQNVYCFCWIAVLFNIT